MTDATLVVDANSLHVAVSVGVDAHHFLTMLLLFYSDANVGIDAIGFEMVYLKPGGWRGLWMIQSTLPCLGTFLQFCLECFNLGKDFGSQKENIQFIVWIH